MIWLTISRRPAGADRPPGGPALRMASPARVLDEIGALDLTPEIRAELLDCTDAAQG